MRRGILAKQLFKRSIDGREAAVVPDLKDRAARLARMPRRIPLTSR